MTSYPDLIKNYTKVILTPNVVEFSRLYHAVVRFFVVVYYGIMFWFGDSKVLNFYQGRLLVLVFMLVALVLVFMVLV